MTIFSGHWLGDGGWGNLLVGLKVLNYGAASQGFLLYFVWKSRRVSQLSGRGLLPRSRG